MALDIANGDFLVVNGEEYPIKAVRAWDFRASGSRSFRRMCTVSASTKRAPGIVSGRRGPAVVNLTGLTCTPLDPVDGETRQRLALDTPHSLVQTFAGDGTSYVHLIMEDLKA